MSLWIEALNTAITSSLHKEDGPPSPSAPEKKYVLLYIFVHIYIYIHIHTNVWLEFLCKPKIHCVLNNFSGLITILCARWSHLTFYCQLKLSKIALLDVSNVVWSSEAPLFACILLYQMLYKPLLMWWCYVSPCKTHNQMLYVSL